MKKYYKAIASAFVVGAAVVIMTGCDDSQEGYSYGKAVSFRCLSQSHGTRALYSGTVDADKEIINWENDDIVRIYCEQASNTDPKYADYTVSGASGVDAKIGPTTVGTELKWGTGAHTFYAVYPSPKTASSWVTDIDGKTVTATVNATQNGNGEFSDGMAMVAKTIVADPKTFDKDGVFLQFAPITTAIKFSLKNGFTSAVTIKKIELKSENHALSGTYTYDIDTNTASDESGSVSADEKKVLINTTTTLAANEGDPAFVFTFFLRPDDNLDDLYIELTDDNEVIYTSELRTNGGAYTFEKGTKTFIQGIVLDKRLTLQSISADPVNFLFREDQVVNEEILF